MIKILWTSICLAFVLLLTSGSAYSAGTTHKVKNGDNLYTIAKKYHVSVNKLKGINGISSTKLKIGQVITISSSTPAKARKGKRTITIAEPAITETDGEFIEYRAKRGDTIDRLASRFNVDKDDILEANNMKEAKRLKPGKTVLIPKVSEEEGGEEYVTLTTKPLKSWKNQEEKYMLVKVAKSFMGAPYRYGGESVRGLDCSAYVKKIYDIFDVQLPRSAREQFTAGSRINKDDLSVGDLVFFKTKRYVKYPTHVGIYIGDGSFIHSSSTHNKMGVKIDTLSSNFYTRTFMGAVRLKKLPEESSAGSINRLEQSSNNS